MCVCDEYQTIDGNQAVFSVTEIQVHICDKFRLHAKGIMIPTGLDPFTIHPKESKDTIVSVTEFLLANALDTNVKRHFSSMNFHDNCASDSSLVMSDDDDDEEWDDEEDEEEWDEEWDDEEWDEEDDEEEEDWDEDEDDVEWEEVEEDDEEEEDWEDEDDDEEDWDEEDEDDDTDV